MELRQLGRSGVRVSRLGLGTMTWGRDTDEHEAAEQLRFYLDAGGNFIDTAAVYGNGDAERVLGGFLGVMVPRDQIIIATKAGISFKSGERVVDNSRTSTGRARHVGISNFAGWQLARAVTLQNPIFGKAPIISTQNEYSLLNRKIEGEILPASRELGVGVLAWSPLGRGVLTGKYRSGLPSDSRGASPHFSSFIEPYLDERSRKIVEAVMVASDGLGLSPLEVSLAWVRDCPGVTSAIIGARTGAQLRGALSAESVTLPVPVREALDEISAI
jgi:aryl-alcohol dehydrogenase-like predicted oxidoreductase